MIARVHPPQRLCRAGTLLGRAVIWFVLLATLAAVVSGIFQQLPADLQPAFGGTDWATLGLLAALTAVVFALCQALTCAVRNEAVCSADGGAGSDLGENP